MRFSFAVALGAAAALGLILAGPVRAHEGHVHGDQPKPSVIVSSTPRGEASSSDFELVAIARGNALALYLDRFATNEPVEGATIEVETPEGPITATATPGDAYSLPAPWLGKAGKIELIFTITVDGTTDILPLTLNVPEPVKNNGSMQTNPFAGLIDAPIQLMGAGLIGLAIGAGAMAFGRRVLSLVLLFLLLATGGPADAHEGHDHGDQPKVALTTSRDLAQRLPDGSIYVPKGTQRIFAVRTLVTETRTHKSTTELPGRVIPDPNASGYVQAAVGGRLSAPPGGFPRLGTPVKEGDILAYVTPPLQAIDVSDIRQKQGELDQQISIVERRMARFETLAPKGAIANSQLEDTRSELLGLKDRRASLDKSRREPEALIAPVTGVVADGNAIAGQIAQPNAIVFHIIEPSKLWVEALSFNAVVNAKDASAKTGTGKNFAISYRGSGFADRSQSIPVHFAIEGDLSGLRAGQFVSVLVSTENERKGIAIPRSALVRAGNGQDVVFEHVGAETFVARPVRVEPLDGERVLVSAGVEPGKRIVTQGAELLDHVR